MKYIIYLSTILGIAFTSTSCVTINPGQIISEVQFGQVVNFIEPTVYFAASRVLEKSVSPEDLAEKAKIINLLSQAILTTLETGSPNPDQLEQAMIAILPDKLHWAQLVSDITEVYVAVYAKQPDASQNSNLYIIAVKDIAKGLIRATKVYMK